MAAQRRSSDWACALGLLVRARLKRDRASVMRHPALDDCPRLSCAQKQQALKKEWYKQRSQAVEAFEARSHWSHQQVPHSCAKRVPVRCSGHVHAWHRCHDGACYWENSLASWQHSKP
jgi:hypothetical protein